MTNDPSQETPPAPSAAPLPPSADSVPVQKTVPITANELIDDEPPAFPERAQGDASEKDGAEKAQDLASTPQQEFGPVDETGTVFNEGIHKRDEYGNPLKRKGRFVRLTGGRPRINPEPASTSKSPEANAAPTFNEPPLPPPSISGDDLMFQRTAEMAVIMTTGFCATIISPAWALRGEQEKNMLAGPLAAYLKSKNITELSPGWMCVACFAMYASARVTDQTTRSKFERAWSWTKEKVFGLYARYKARKGAA